MYKKPPLKPNRPTIIKVHLVEKEEILFGQKGEKTLPEINWKEIRTPKCYLLELVGGRNRKKIVPAFSRKSTHLLIWDQNLLFEVVAAEWGQCEESIKGKRGVWGRRSKVKNERMLCVCKKGYEAVTTNLRGTKQSMIKKKKVLNQSCLRIRRSQEKNKNHFRKQIKIKII